MRGQLVSDCVCLSGLLLAANVLSQVAVIVMHYCCLLFIGDARGDCSIQDIVTSGLRELCVDMHKITFCSVAELQRQVWIRLLSKHRLAPKKIGDGKNTLTCEYQSHFGSTNDIHFHDCI